jgi:hypothetical protein
MVFLMFGVADQAHIFALVQSAHAAENLFYGSSGFENLASTQIGKSSVFQLNIQYDTGPDELENIVPVFAFYPESAGPLIRIESGSLDRLTRNEVGVITNTITINSGISFQNVFVSVYFAGTDRSGNYYESGWIDSIVMDIGQQSVPPVPPIVDDGTLDELESLPPLKQLRAGVSSENIVCKEGLVVVIKTSNGNPSCVKPETKIKLLERGWIR